MRFHILEYRDSDIHAIHTRADAPQVTPRAHRPVHSHAHPLAIPPAPLAPCSPPLPPQELIRTAAGPVQGADDDSEKESKNVLGPSLALAAAKLRDQTSETVHQSEAQEGDGAADTRSADTDTPVATPAHTSLHAGATRTEEAPSLAAVQQKVGARADTHAAAPSNEWDPFSEIAASVSGARRVRL